MPNTKKYTSIPSGQYHAILSCGFYREEQDYYLLAFEVDEGDAVGAKVWKRLNFNTENAEKFSTNFLRQLGIGERHETAIGGSVRCVINVLEKHYIAADGAEKTSNEIESVEGISFLRANK